MGIIINYNYSSIILVESIVIVTLFGDIDSITIIVVTIATDTII